MGISLPLPSDKKLIVTYRVEPGCLGPEGADHIKAFCTFAEKGVADVDADFVHWHIIPRYDKTLPEMHYAVNNKELTHDQADQYLNVFQKGLDEFECHLQDKLALLIDSYWER